jgi:pumilio RNA-binding family
MLERSYTYSLYNEVNTQEWTDNQLAEVMLPFQYAPFMMVPVVPIADSGASIMPAIENDMQPCDSSQAGNSSQPPFTHKELMKLRKKLREIARIEERIAAGETIDHLQRNKMDTKPELIADLELVERYRRGEQAMDKATIVQPREDQDAKDETGATSHIPLAHMPVQCVSFDGAALPWTEVSLPQSCDTADVLTSEFAQGVEDEYWHPQQGMYSMIEQAQMQAAMRAEQEEVAYSIGGSRRRRRGQRGRAGPTPKFTHAELTQSLQGGDDTRSEALADIRGSVLRLSLEASGCRIVQLALEVADVTTATELIEELHGHVRELIESPHGNYVAQKVVEVLPSAQTGFVIEELRGVGANVARHRYGCRILCRLLEHCASEADMVTLIDEILDEADDLCRHSFGHHVIQSVLEQSPNPQQKQVVVALCRDLPRHVWNRNSSFVIEKVLTHCQTGEQRMLVEQLVNEGPDMVTSLSQSRLGPHVAKVLPALSRGLPEKVLGGLRMATGGLQGSKYGKRLLKDINSAMASVVTVSA